MISSSLPTLRRLAAMQAISSRSAVATASLTPGSSSSRHLLHTGTSAPRAPSTSVAVGAIPPPPSSFSFSTGGLLPSSFARTASAAALGAGGGVVGLLLQSPQQQQQQQIRHRSNRSRRGLYDGKDVRTGNRVSFSMRKTKRKFKPNVFKKSVYSETLDEMVRFHLTASALRSIDKAGGLDNYLLTSRHVTSGEGLECKNRILKKMRKDAKRKERAEERARVAAAAAAEEEEGGVKMEAASRGDVKG